MIFVQYRLKKGGKPPAITKPADESGKDERKYILTLQ